MLLRRWRSSGFSILREMPLWSECGQQHQIAPRQNQIGGDARPLGADRAFGHLHDDLAPRRILARDVLLRDARAVAPLGLAFHHFHPAVEGRGDDVPIMEKGVLLKADVHKGRLQVVLQIAHLALENAAHQPLLRGALDGEFLQAPLLLDGHAGFERFGVDDDFLVGPAPRA